MSNYCDFEEGDVKLTTEYQYDKGLKLVFVHMFFDDMTAQTIRNIRLAFSRLKDHYKQEDHLVVFGLTDDPQVVRLWELVETPYELIKVRADQWLGSWLTEEI